MVPKERKISQTAKHSTLSAILNLLHKSGHLQNYQLNFRAVGIRHLGYIERSPSFTVVTCTYSDYCSTEMAKISLRLPVTLAIVLSGRSKKGVPDA